MVFYKNLRATLHSHRLLPVETSKPRHPLFKVVVPSLREQQNSKPLARVPDEEPLIGSRAREDLESLVFLESQRSPCEVLRKCSRNTFPTARRVFPHDFLEALPKSSPQGRANPCFSLPLGPHGFVTPRWQWRRRLGSSCTSFPNTRVRILSSDWAMRLMCCQNEFIYIFIEFQSRFFMRRDFPMSHRTFTKRFFF